MFNLLRYFSLTSAIVTVMVAVGLGMAYRQYSIAELVAAAEVQNVGLAQTFSNTIWSRFSAHVASVADPNGDALRAHPQTRSIHEAVQTLARGTPVLKVKIYDVDGLTVYSSEARQIGDDKSANRGFLVAALQGMPASKLSYRDTFSAFSGVVEDRDLVETYIPIRSAAGRIEGVFELYTDVTPLLERIGASTAQFISGLVLSFGVLYGVLFLIVRRADRIIKKQYAELRDNDQRIKSKNAALSDAHERMEQRVEERTVELRRNEHNLRLARDEAQAANRAKSEFLAAMSHELRTPLNAIIGFSEIIERETFGPVGTAKYGDYAHDINASGHHLLSVINDILDLSKIEFGEEDLREESTDVPGLVRSALTLVGQRSEERGLELVVEIPDKLPPLWADARKVKQILVNLLTNSIKFTEPGGKVTIRAWCPTDGGHAVQVIDTGIGISPADLPKALPRFGQVDSDLNRQYEGSGLGLPLCEGLRRGAWRRPRTAERGRGRHHGDGTLSRRTDGPVTGPRRSSDRRAGAPIRAHPGPRAPVGWLLTDWAGAPLCPPWVAGRQALGRERPLRRWADGVPTAVAAMTWTRQSAMPARL